MQRCIVAPVDPATVAAITPAVDPVADRRGFLTRLGFRAGLTAATSLLASACSPLSLINGLVPASTYREDRDLAYGPLTRQRLDVYHPASPRGEPARSDRPLIVFFYGGSWNSGRRTDYRFVGEALASRGFTVVIPDYRLYPEVRFPDFLDDCAAAVAWASRHASSDSAPAASADAAPGLRPTDPARRVVLMGHSAGAYNAAMLALDNDLLAAAQVDRSRIAAFVGLAGPYDFLPLTSQLTQSIFGYPNTPPGTQPIHFASASAPPTLLLTADDDKVVNPGNSDRLAARLAGFKVPVQRKSYPRLSHPTLVGAMAAPLRSLAPVLDDVVAFLDGPLIG